MYLTADKVVNALVCAQGVLRDNRIFAGSPDLLPISLDATTDVIKEKSGYNIILRDVVFEATRLYGRCERYDDQRVEIDIRSDLT